MTAEAEEHDDLGTILPVEGTVQIEGVTCRVRRLKARELLFLIRIFVNGLGPGIKDIKFDLEDQNALAKDVGAVLMLALPNAIEDTIAFTQSIVEPVDVKHSPAINKSMSNPDLDVLVDVMTKVVEQEHKDFRALVGKLQALARRVGDLYLKGVGG